MLFGTLGRQSGQLDKAVTSLSELIHGLAERRTDISNAVAYTNAATKTIADLLNQAQEPVKNVVNETSRVSDVVLADRDYVDNLLNTLPDKYQMLGRQGIYGDYFSFYFCDIVLKLNGKGGQPVFVKVAGQDAGGAHPNETEKAFSERNPVLLGAIGIAVILAWWLPRSVIRSCRSSTGQNLCGLLRRCGWPVRGPSSRCPVTRWKGVEHRAG